MLKSAYMAPQKRAAQLHVLNFITSRSTFFAFGTRRRATRAWIIIAPLPFQCTFPPSVQNLIENLINIIK
jgi:hypothetical protein